MLKLEARQILAVLLCVLVSNPPSMVASSTVAGSRGVVGSISSRGPVQVDDVTMPTEGTLFSGDRVATNSGGAVIHYKDGARVVLASESLANFAPARVQLEKGLMMFQTTSANGVVFSASTLRLEPQSSKSAANVTMKDNKASVAVTQGSLKVLNESGLLLASLKAGDARLFEESPAGSPEPAASSAAPSGAPAAAAPPQGGGGSNAWKWALAAALGGVGIGAAALARNNNSDNSSLAGLQAQVVAVQAQAAALQARLNALSLVSAREAAISADLAQQLQKLATLQQQISSGQISSAAAAAQLNSIIAAINADNNAFGLCQRVASANDPNQLVC